MIKKALIDCLSTTTGHGLPQMVRSGNLFLSLLWAFSFLVGLGGAVFMIFLAFQEFLQYDVITTTKIKKENALILPAITFCAENTESSFNKYIARDMLLDCTVLSKLGYLTKCDFTDLSLYDHYYLTELKCVQFNFKTNKTELTKVENEGYMYSVRFEFYIPINTSFLFALADNSARVIYDDLNEQLFPRQNTYIALSRINQTILGPPFSQCNNSKGYEKAICTDNCFNKNMTETCGCEYPIDCVTIWKDKEDSYSRECLESYKSSETILLNCRNRCAVECNQVIFPFNRIDVESNFEQEKLENYKSKTEKIFNLTDLSLDQLKMRLGKARFYFDRLETSEIMQSEKISQTSLIANIGGLLGKYIFCLLTHSSLTY